MRRRSFAASMVVTFSLAEMACTSTSTSTNAPPPDDGDDAAADDVGEPLPGNPPGPGVEPEPEPEPKEPDTVTSKEEIVMEPDGTCIRYVSVDCPPGMACNPPPPEQVPCPEGMLPKPTVAANVNERDDGTCWESFEVDCPEGARCNPPPPRQVECPPGEQ